MIIQKGEGTNVNVDIVKKVLNKNNCQGDLI